jgi:nucleotide-binding universal stress UspA family protein
MFKRMLVPLDGSARAEEALPVAARIARACGGSVHLLEVVSPVIDYGGFAVAPMTTEEVLESDLAAVDNYLKQVAASPAFAGIPTTTEDAFGPPAQSILAAATSGEFDLIVLCSHGRTGFTRWALGSVAHTLAHESGVPTLILHESKPTAPFSLLDTAQPIRALVPLDGSELAEAALAPASALVAALSAPAKGMLHLAEVVALPQSSAGEGFSSKLYEEAVERAKVYLARVTEGLQAPDKQPRLAMTSSVRVEQDVAAALVGLAEDGTWETGACDLIAMSTHGRHGPERWVMGSVTDRVLNATRLPILIVRPAKRK